MIALDASSIAALLREFGQRSALNGGNPFRAKAYSRAADHLLALSLPIDQVIAQKRLREIPGVGDAIADIITTLHATGTHPALEKMRKEIPANVLEMLTVPGLSDSTREIDLTAGVWRWRAKAACRPGAC
jgi:DNA polymerase (family X)